MFPNYANAITDLPGQSTTNFIPPPGLIRNSFGGPDYRDLDLNIAKAFGLPKMRVLGEGAQIEIKANMLNALNFLISTPAPFRPISQTPTSARHQAHLDQELSIFRPASASKAHEPHTRGGFS